MQHMSLDDENHKTIEQLTVRKVQERHPNYYTTFFFTSQDTLSISTPPNLR